MPILQSGERRRERGRAAEWWWWYLPQHNTLCTLTCINSSFGGRWRAVRLVVLRGYIHPLFCVMYPLSCILVSSPAPTLLTVCPLALAVAWPPLATHQSASAATLPGAGPGRGRGSRNCVVRDNNNNSWIRKRLSWGYFEPHNHQTITAVGDDQVFTSWKKKEMQKTTCSFPSKTVAIYFPFWREVNTMFQISYICPFAVLLPCQSFIVPRRRDAIENTKYILYKLLINIGCICRIALNIKYPLLGHRIISAHTSVFT